ncbi:MAG TPA: BON domain-containing protein [Rhodanobacteraceae bacterium]
MPNRGAGFRGGAEPARDYGGEYESLQRTQSLRYGEGGGEQARGFRGRGPKNYTRSDERIREDISERLWDADDVDASDVSVEVRDGVVSLRGNVEQRRIKHRIEDIADSCGGVRDIRNDIRVQSRSDWPYDKQVAPGSLQGASPATEQAGGGTMSALEDETSPRSH